MLLQPYVRYRTDRFPCASKIWSNETVCALPNGNGGLPETELVMESEDRDELKERAQELAKEICEAIDPALVGAKWVDDGEDELILEGYCRFAIRR